MMKQLKVLLIVLVAATLGLAVSLFLLVLSREPGASPLNLLFQILTEGPPADVPLFIPLSPLLFLTAVLASMVGVIYFLVLPEIKTYYEPESKNSIRTAAQMIMRTLKPEEQKVVEILKVHGGKYLQKYITKEAGLSKVKTHRIIAGLSERGIVQVVKQANTNQVSLSDWFHEAIKP